tara:strand:- start:105 stop:311 length:207 start_codon:yes stop_codon:yes gene_type:complete
LLSIELLKLNAAYNKRVEVAGLVVSHSTLPRILKTNDIFNVRNGMALRCAYGSTNAVYLGIRYKENQD